VNVTILTLLTIHVISLSAKCKLQLKTQASVDSDGARAGMQ